MYQSGATFEIPKEGFQPPAEIPLADLQKYLGSYDSDKMGKVTVLIQSNHLALDVPGQMVYELFPPDSDGKWYFRVTDKIYLKFSAVDGTVASLTLYQGGQEFLSPRSKDQTTLPTVDDILKLRHGANQEAALKALGTLRMDGTVYIVQSGIHGKFTVFVGNDGKYRVNEDYGKYGAAYSAFDGTQAWTKSDFAPFEKLNGKLLQQARQGDPRSLLGDWRLYFDSVQVLRSETLNTREVFVVELQKGNLPPITIYVDATNGDILQSKINSVQEGGFSIPVTITYDNYQEVKGLRLAFRETSSNDMSGSAIVDYQKIETNLTVDANYFILTP
jgi:hypothetical protein